MVQKRHTGFVIDRSASREPRLGAGNEKEQPAGIGMTPSKTELGSFVRKRRLELDLRQIPLAEQCGFNQRDISNIESGIRKYLDSDKLNKLAQALQCDVEELRKLTPVKPGSQPTTELGKLIRSRREELGMKIESFAKKMKITPGRAKRLEIRKNAFIRYNLLRPLAKALALNTAVLAKFAGRTCKKSKSELGNLIRSRRRELGMSIEMLANKLDVSRQLVNQIEFGQQPLSRNDEMLAKIAKALQLDIDVLKTVRPESRLKKVENNSNPLGGFLATARLGLHLTQREVSERAGISSAVVCALENGRLPVTSNMLEKLQKVLGCQIPPELIPPSRVRQIRVGFSVEREGLGKFITERRLELKLSQTQFAQRADVGSAVISRIERGTYRPGDQMIERLRKALECEIPAELIPAPRSRGRPRGPKDEQERSSSADLDRIKELSDIRCDREAVRKGLKVLRLLLEKQKDGNVVCLRKGNTIVELEFFF